MVGDHEAGHSPRRLRRRRFGPNLPTMALCAAVLFGLWAQFRQSVPPDPPDGEGSVQDVALPGGTENLQAGEYVVRRVVDGDTLLLETGDRIRLIGVNTPETAKEDHPVEAWGPEASHFTRTAVHERTVRLEFDKERKDRYDRYLAYVYYREPSTGEERLLNEALIRAGLGHASPHFRYSETMKRRFLKAQDAARRDRVGLWSDAKRAA